GGMTLMLLSIGLVAAGIGAGWWIYARNGRATAKARDPLEARLPRVWRALATRLGFDELYAATVFRLNAVLAAAADWLDRWVWGGSIRGLAALTEYVAWSN